MADGYLERQQELYEARKAAWLKKKKTIRKVERKPVQPSSASDGQSQ